MDTSKMVWVDVTPPPKAAPKALSAEATEALAAAVWAQEVVEDDDDDVVGQRHVLTLNDQVLCTLTIDLYRSCRGIWCIDLDKLAYTRQRPYLGQYMTMEKAKEAVMSYFSNLIGLSSPFDQEFD